MSKPTAIVIGSGFGGLACAIRLQARGYSVTIAEARDQPGGRAYVYRQDGFTFDAGPTIITAPQLIDELFACAGRRTADYVTLLPIDPYYRLEFHDGRSLEYGSSEAETLRQIAQFNPQDRDGYRRFSKDAKAIFQKGFVELADRPFLSLASMLRIAPDLLRLGAFRTVHSLVGKHIEDPFLRRVFSFHPLLVGGNPFETTSIYALIHHLEKQWGVFYVKGGTGALVQALVRLFVELGGTLRLSTSVRRIAVVDGKSEGVFTSDLDFLPADVVVSNADVANTYRKLIDGNVRRRNTDRRLERMRYSMSLFVLYFGTRKRYEAVRHHTILFCERYRELLADIFRHKRLTDDFSVYLHRPTATDESMAPAGCDSFYALVPVPNQASGIDWRTAASPFRDRLVRFLNDRILPGLEGQIVTERAFTPLDFETTLDSYQGSAFSFEPIFRQSAWFRPHNESEDVRGLYFVGAGTHPGAGVPGVLSSAKIAEDLICRNPRAA